MNIPSTHTGNTSMQNQKIKISIIIKSDKRQQRGGARLLGPICIHAGGSGTAVPSMHVWRNGVKSQAVEVEEGEEEGGGRGERNALKALWPERTRRSLPPREGTSGRSYFK